MATDENPPHRPVISPRARIRVLAPADPESISEPSAGSPARDAAPVAVQGRWRIVQKQIEVAPVEETVVPPAMPPTVEPPSSEPQKVKRARGDRTGPNWDENGDYIHGKYRPPVERRFQPGHVVNKKGPKVGDVDFIKAMNKELDKKIPIKVGGKKMALSTIQLIAHGLRAKIVEGNISAMKVAAEWKMKGEAQSGNAAAPLLSPAQWTIIDKILSEAGFDANPVVRKTPGETSDEG